MANRIQPIVRMVPFIWVALSIAIVAYAVWHFVPRSEPTVLADIPREKTEIERIDALSLPSEAWSVISGHIETAPESNQQYRLAGTFFLMNTPGANDEGQRLAIIDDVGANRQHIVSEKQSFDGYEILRIHADRLLMRRDGIEIELTLSFKDGVISESASTDQPEEVLDGEEVTLETSRFGRRIGEQRWVMEKKALVGYYQELLDNPERIAQIYMSMKPDYVDGEVGGYRLEQEGEQEFFKAVGLQEGDAIRMVNSMRMTSQARAEYFISEFMKERLGAVVIDIERNGQPEKLIYLFR